MPRNENLPDREETSKLCHDIEWNVNFETKKKYGGGEVFPFNFPLVAKSIQLIINYVLEEDFFFFWKSRINRCGLHAYSPRFRIYKYNRGLEIEWCVYAMHLCSDLERIRFFYFLFSLFFPIYNRGLDMFACEWDDCLNTGKILFDCLSKNQCVELVRVNNWYVLVICRMIWVDFIG